MIVIGGGDTGTDCIGTSVRHGAKQVRQNWPLLHCLINQEILPVSVLGLLCLELLQWEGLRKGGWQAPQSSNFLLWEANLYNAHVLSCLSTCSRDVEGRLTGLGALKQHCDNLGPMIKGGGEPLCCALNQ